jgi:hypothetical protein
VARGVGGRQDNRTNVRSLAQGVSGHGFSRAADHPSLKISPTVRVSLCENPDRRPNAMFTASFSARLKRLRKNSVGRCFVTRARL